MRIASHLEPGSPPFSPAKELVRRARQGGLGGCFRENDKRVPQWREAKLLKADAVHLNTNAEHLEADAEHMKTNAERLEAGAEHIEVNAERLEADAEHMEINAEHLKIGAERL